MAVSFISSVVVASGGRLTALHGFQIMSLFRRPMVLACGCCALSVASQSNGQTQLLLDDFDQSGIADPRTWRLPFDTEGTFVGRTQFRTDFGKDFPLQGVAEPAATDGLVMEIDLDTFSPLDPGNQFFGTDILTKRNFARAGGLTLEARMRLKPPTTGGLVNGFFLFDVVRDSPPGSNNLVRDEIDWELLSNQTQGTATQDPFSNFWNDGGFDNNGDGAFHDVAGVDLTQFQDYKIEWTPEHIKWFVNDTLVRTQTSNIPDDPMKLHFNIWAAAEDFGDAYDASLQPAATEGTNQRFQVQVDHVKVNRINTSSIELLNDGSFETTLPCSLSGNGPACSSPDTTTGEWIGFNNQFLAFGEEVPPSDGSTTLKMFGPFKGAPDASGIFQNAVASPGQEFEASVMAHVPSFDSIRPNPGGDYNADGTVNVADYVVWRDNLGSSIELPNDTTDETTIGIVQYDLWKENFGETAGTENFTQLVLTFHDENGAVIQEAFGSPTDMRDKNANDVPIFDGRDPNLDSLEDEWIKYSVNALAPDGTAFVRYNLFFIQLANQGGAVHFDEASLLRLDPLAMASLASASVPEPGASTLLLFGLAATVVIRYRWIHRG